MQMDKLKSQLQEIKNMRSSGNISAISKGVDPAMKEYSDKLSQSMTSFKSNKYDRQTED